MGKPSKRKKRLRKFKGKEPVPFVLDKEVVELHPTENGILVLFREKDHQGGFGIAARNVIAAAKQERPPGWVPRAGEAVFVLPEDTAGKPTAGRRRKGTIAAVIERAIDLFFKVRFSGRAKDQFVPYERLVPRDAKLLIECERIPKDGTKNSESAPTLF